MKKILYILFAMTFALCSCTEEIDLQDTAGKECIKLTVFNSPMTKADAGPDYERNLTHLDVFFYVEGQTDRPCVYYQRVTDSKYLTGAAEIPFYVVEEQINQIFPNGNTCDVLVIANLPDGIRPVKNDGTTKATFGTGLEGTEYNRLTALLLEKGNGYDDVGQNFIMAGFDGNVRKDGNNNASGTVKLVRASSKITITVNIPEKIVLDASEDSEEITMVPVLLDDLGNVPFKTALHNGVKYGHVYPAGMVDSDMSVLTDEWYFDTDKEGYTKLKEIPAEGTTGVKKYQYTCEIPFYSYSSSWQKGDERAAHLTLEIPWKREAESQYHTYYYQILVNAGGRRLDPNHWYDLYVNVGVIGSTVEAKPVELDDMTVYVLDWTTEPDPEDTAGGDRYEDVEMEQYTYLNVPQKRIEINNANTGVLRFEASHNVGVKLNTNSKVDEVLNTTTTLGAFYINAGVGKTERPKLSPLNITPTNNFVIDNEKNTLTLNHEIPSNVYSPIYVYATIWLQLDDNEGMSETEALFAQDVVIVQNPPMYIIPDESNVYSIYVNQQQTDASNDYKIGNHNLGRNPGHSNTTWDGNPSFMQTITVTAFKDGNTFLAHDNNRYPYIIGDPRSRISDIEMDDDNNATNISSNWVSTNAILYDANGQIVRDANGDIQYETRKLQYYYPTETEGNAFQIVSPKFRMVSFFSSGWGYITSKGAEMRCATFQEDGYPAGRWRLPTEAEIMFVVDLQKAGVITDVFYGSSEYFSATEVNNTTRYKISYPQNGTPSWSSATTGSVRCVYDEWYWGSEREAKENPDWKGSHTTKGDNEYLFTWGDKQIWDENGNPL